MRVCVASAYFLSLLSPPDVLPALDGDEPTSSVSHVVCLLFPYNTLGAELLSWAEVGVVVAARTGRAFSAVGVLYPCGVYALAGRMRGQRVRLSTTRSVQTLIPSPLIPPPPPPP